MATIHNNHCLVNLLRICFSISIREEQHRFEIDMNFQNVDWQAHVYGGAMHAFATPNANDPA